MLMQLYTDLSIMYRAFAFILKMLQDLPKGANIVGVLPGTNWGTMSDRPIVVGAHWDTVPYTPGYDDNGSGVVAVLETASALINAKCHRNKHSIIFVLFDLEELGCFGSLEFIRSFLMPKFKQNNIHIQVVE